MRFVKFGSKTLFTSRSKPSWCCWNFRRHIANILIAEMRNNKALNIKDSSLTTTKDLLLQSASTNLF